MRTILFLTSFMLSSPNLYAQNTDRLFDQLKSSSAKFEIVGAVCEQAARIDFEREFPPPRFSVETGISYGDSGRTIGELDVIVFDEAKRAVQVAEVKCWKNSAGGLRKAKEQGSRFVRAVGMKGITFRHEGDREHLASEFAAVSKVLTVGPLGVSQVGYDKELQYSLDELMQVRQRLLECRASGECAVGKKSTQL